MIFSCVPVVSAYELGSYGFSTDSVDMSSFEAMLNEDNLSELVEEVLETAIADCGQEEFCVFIYDYSPNFAEFYDNGDYESQAEGLVEYFDKILEDTDLNAQINDYKVLISMVLKGVTLDLNSLDGVIGTIVGIFNFLSNKGRTFAGDLSSVDVSALKVGSGKNAKVVSSANSTPEEIIDALLAFISAGDNVSFVTKLIEGKADFGSLNDTIKTFAKLDLEKDVAAIFSSINDIAKSDIYLNYLKGDSEKTFEESAFSSFTLDEIIDAALYALCTGEIITSADALETSASVYYDIISNIETYSQKYSFKFEMFVPGRLPEFILSMLCNKATLKNKINADASIFDGISCNETSKVFEKIVSAVYNSYSRVNLADKTLAEELIVLSADIFENRNNPEPAHIEEIIPGKPATCTESGISDGIMCSVCGEILVEQEEIPALGHTIERIEGKLPTCTEPGLSYGEKCSVCGIIITEQTETEPWGHEETTLRGFLMPTTSSEGYSGDTVCVLCSEIVKKGSVISVKKTPVIEVSPVEGNIGDTVSVVVSGKNIIGLESFAFVFEYDETVLEFVNIDIAENAERLMGMGGKPENTTNAITFSGFWLNSHGDMCISSDSDLAVITFKIIGEGDRTVAPALNNGEWSDYYDMPPALENYCFHETEIQGFVLPSYETGGYSGDKVCTKCNEILEAGKELPVKKQPSFEFSSTDAKVGETVTITVNLKDSVSFSAGYLELTYDAEYLKYADVQSNDKQLLIGMINDETEDKVGLLLFATFSQPYTYSDTSFDIQFVVLKDGSSEMTMIQNNDWSDEFGIPPSPATYTFTTACEHVEEVISAKSATCTGKGLTEGKKCSSCGEILVAQKEIAAKGHTPGSWEVSKKAEIGKEGKEVKKCTVCKAVVDERAIAALKEEGKPGDVDGNGKITAADARLALRISAKLEKATEYQTRIADMDKNNKITAADARKILRISAKLE